MHNAFQNNVVFINGKLDVMPLWKQEQDWKEMEVYTIYLDFL